VITLTRITAAAAAILAKDHHNSADLDSVSGRLEASISPASNALTNARKIEMVFIRTPPSGFSLSIVRRDYQSLRKDSHFLQNTGGSRDMSNGEGLPGKSKSRNKRDFMRNDLPAAFRRA